MNQVLTLIDYLNSNESSYYMDGYIWTIDRIKSMLDEGSHSGDCRNEPQTCEMCALQGILDEYEEYCREKGGIK